MPLTQSLAEAWPPAVWRDCHVLVATSGGADSVALLRALAELRGAEQGGGEQGGELIVAHYNHRTRGEASGADARWVRGLAEHLGLACEMGEASSELASEESARAARYQFLLRAAERRGARYVATAHTADDQTETVLMRVLRGSGIEGLAGIPRLRPLSGAVSLVRPLLGVRRAEIEAYLAELNQHFRTDETNLRSQFTRNWVRNELLPLVRERLPGDPDLALRRLADQAGEWTAALDELTGELAEQAIAGAGGEPCNGVELDTVLLAAEPAIVVQHVCRQAWRRAGWPLQAMGMLEWQRLARAVADASTPVFQLPGGVTVSRRGYRLRLSRDAEV